MTKHLRFNQAPSTALCLFAVLIGMGLLQTFARPSGARREKPGPTRGDLVLPEEALPAEIAGWTRTKFIPAPPVDELPDGQYWWVHQWQYQKDGATALVSFDQLGETQWHELTYCYRVLGWTVHSRTEYECDDGGGPYIAAELRKGRDEVAWLVFSAFFEDGSWATPPTVDLTRLHQRPHVPVPGFLETATERVAPTIYFDRLSSGHTRALQCQVLVTGLSSDMAAELQSAISLHLGSRQRFQSRWLAAKP